MSKKTALKQWLIDKSGYWIHKRQALPVGFHLFEDFKLKLQFTPNVIFDVGANIGQSSVVFNRHFPQATIHAFEPIHSTFNVLQNNCKLFLNKIQLNHCALGAAEEELEINIFEGEDSVLNSLNPNAMAKGSGKKETISVKIGDSYCQANNILQIDLLKIDTEGFELEVLKGFSSMLQSGMISAVYAEVGFSADNKRNTFLPELLSFLSEKGFLFFGLYDISHYQIEKKLSFGNALFVHNTYLERKKIRFN